MIYNKYFSKESLGKLYISSFWQWATKGLHLKSTGGCVPEGCGLNRFVRRGNYSSPKGSQLSSWLLPKQSVSEQWWNYRADLWSTAPKLPEPESYRMFITRPGRHREQSAPTAGNVTSRRGRFWSLVAILAGVSPSSGSSRPEGWGPCGEVQRLQSWGLESQLC